MPWIMILNVKDAQNTTLYCDLSSNFMQKRMLFLCIIISPGFNVKPVVTSVLAGPVFTPFPYLPLRASPIIRSLSVEGHYEAVNTLRWRQNGRHFPDDIFKWIFLNENGSVLIDISLKFVHNGQINNIPALGQIMAWRRSCDKPLSDPMMVSSLTHICVTRPQWVQVVKEPAQQQIRWTLHQ